VRTPTVRAAHGLLPGELNSSAQVRWLKTVEVFNEQGERRQLNTVSLRWAAAKTIPTSRSLGKEDSSGAVRPFRNCFLALELWKRLGLTGSGRPFWRRRPLTCRSRVAALLAINRLCAP